MSRVQDHLWQNLDLTNLPLHTPPTPSSLWSREQPPGMAAGGVAPQGKDLNFFPSLKVAFGLEY